MSTASTKSDCPVCGEGPFVRLLTHIGRAHSKKQQERVLIDELRRLADELGRAPTAKEMDEQGRFCIQTYDNHFGGWNEALEEAYLPLNREVDISDEELIDELLRLTDKLGRAPTSLEIIEFAEYSVRTYHRRFDSYSAALDEARRERRKTKDI